MKEIATYENDQDLYWLSNTEITDESILDFIFKKGGSVNWNNLSYILNNYNRKDISQIFINLKANGLINVKSHTDVRVTAKARWKRFRDSKTLITIGVICGIISFLILLLQVSHILK
ncbi:MAG TPA: hypothetical protein VET23_04900 [Chitinophagaceae bacterium]|nr:hypothetical protein [Chitinophagaceae bacterium]